MADETQVTTEEQRNSPGIAFITHGNLKHDPPLHAFITHGNLKHDPPLHAFITYAKGVDTDGEGEISTQLLNFSASAKKENNKTTIAISWNLNGLHHAVIHVKKVQAEADNEVDWTGVEVADTLTLDQGVTSTEYEAQEGYKYQIEGVGVDVFGDTSEAANTPKAEVFIAKAVDPNPNPNPNPEPDPSPEQPTEKLFEFHYVPDEGVLPGLIFEQQTEDVINDIGNYAYFAQKTASKALKTGLEASEAARTALNAAQNAQSTADRATELANTGISKADAAQETASKALKKAETNEVSIAANSSSIATLQNTVNSQQTQLNGNLTDISGLQKQVTENKQGIDGNSKGISQCIMTIQESQRYTTTDKTDANDLTDYGRIYLPTALLHCPSGVTYPVLLDIVPSYLDDYQIDDVVIQRVVDSNGVSFYRLATETTVDATTTYTFGDWKSIDTRYLKLTGGTVTGQTSFSGKLVASGETTFSGKLTASGETSVPTPSTENNSKTIANTEFVHGVVSELVNGAPDALDTLQELATALGDDPNFSTTILNKIGEKESKTDAQIEYEKLQDSIDTKQNLLTFDTTPEYGSENPVTSDGIKKAIEAVEAGAPDLTPYMKKTADSNLSMGSYSLSFPGVTISSNMVNSVPMLTIKATGTLGVNVDGNLMMKDATVATEDYVSTAIPTEVSQLSDDVGIAKISNGHLIINGSELWIE